MEQIFSHLKVSQPLARLTRGHSPSENDKAGSAPTKAKPSGKSVQLEPSKPVDTFSRTNAQEHSELKSWRFVRVRNTDFGDAEEEIGEHEALGLPNNLVSEEHLTLARNIFYRYVGVAVDNKPLHRTPMWLIKKFIRRQVTKWHARNEKTLLQAFKKIGPEQVAALGFALGLQAARRFDKEDAVDFMLLIAETLSEVSHHIDSNCWRYSKFAVSMEDHAGDYRQFPIATDEDNFVLNMRVPLSVRGRLAFLAAAQADEMCQATYPQIAAGELVERSEQMAQEKCTILFGQPWCQFDSEHYINF